MAITAPFSPEAILNLASAIRNNGDSAAFSFGTDAKPLDSAESLLYVVRFPDNVTWIFRVPVQAGFGLTPGALGSFVESEAVVLRTLEKAEFRWSPRLIHYDTGTDNPIQHPYLVRTWIEGRELEWSDTVPSDPEDRAKVLRQITDIQLELAERTKVLRPGSSTLGFLTGMVDGQLMRAATGRESVLGIRACLVHRALVRHAVHEALEWEPSIFTVSHDALTAHNIIVDPDYNVTGLVGWCFARTLPKQLALRLPRFLAIEPESPLETASPPPADVSAFAKEYLQPSPALMADRFLIRTYLSSLVSDPDHGERRSPAQVMRDVYSDPDINWRYLIIEACFSRGLHAWLANRAWLMPGTKGELASLVDLPAERLMREVEEFLDGAGANDKALREKLLEAVNGS